MLTLNIVWYNIHTDAFSDHMIMVYVEEASAEAETSNPNKTCYAE